MSEFFDPVQAGRQGPRPLTLSHALRRSFGFLNVLAALAIVVSITTQVIDKINNAEFIPAQYFMYFTIQTSILNVIVLLLGGIIATTRLIDPRWYSILRACIVAYAVVVGVVYNLLLRDLPPGDGYYSSFTYPNEIMHVWVPLFIALEWLLMPGRSRMRWTVLAICAIYPLAWATVSMIRGAVDGWYPYFFLKPDGALGWGGVAVYILGIAVFMVALAAVAVGTQRLHARIFVAAGLDRDRL